MAYEVYQKRSFNGSISSEPTITVTKDAFYVNKAARAEFNIDQYRNVEVHIDREEKKVGLLLLEKPTRNSLRLRVTDGSLTISAHGAIHFYGIKPGRHAASYDSDQDMVEFSYEAAEDEQEDAGEEEVKAETKAQRRARRRA